MAKEYAKKFYKSAAWIKCRKSFIVSYLWRHHGLCEHCKEVPGYIVDHVIEITPNNINDPDITLSHKNLQYLCLECHNTKTFSKYSSVNKGYSFDSDGELIYIPPIKQ